MVTPITVIREIEAQNRRVSKHTVTSGYRGVDVAFVTAHCTTIRDYAYPLRNDLFRLLVVAIPSGLFLDEGRLAKGSAFALPRVHGVVPLCSPPEPEKYAPPEQTVIDPQRADDQFRDQGMVEAPEVVETEDEEARQIKSVQQYLDSLPDPEPLPERPPHPTTMLEAIQEEWETQMKRKLLSWGL